MPVQICPDGRIGVEKRASPDVAELGAFARNDDQWRVLQPIAHLREGVPDVLAVKFGNAVHSAKISFQYPIFSGRQRDKKCLRGNGPQSR